MHENVPSQSNNETSIQPRFKRAYRNEITHDTIKLTGDIVIRLNYNESSHILFTFLAEGKCDPPKQNTFLCRTAFSI